MRPSPLLTQAGALLRRQMVWDNHGCMPLRPFDDRFLPQLERYRAAGVDMAVLNIGYGELGIEDHIRTLAHFRRWLLERPEDYLIVGTADDIELARRTGRLAIAFDMEGANGIGDQPSLLGLYYDLGVRWMLMAYNRNNRVGGGCHDEDGGLTKFGRAVLDEMAQVGMVACCSHTGTRTTLDVMAHSANPVIFSHSNSAAVHSHPRNITDEVALACAATGGVVGLNGIGLFLGDREADLVEAYVRHLDHFVSLLGPDHVGLGFDYVFDQDELNEALAGMAGTFPAGMGYEPGIRMLAPEDLVAVLARLLAMGYPEGDLGKILGGNLMRVARAVWAPASGARQGSETDLSPTPA